MLEHILWIRTIVLGVGLALLGLEDLRKRQIHALPVVLLAVVGMVLSVVGGAWQDATVVLAFLPGLLTLIAARLTGESIGYGDAWVLLSLGCFLTWDEIVSLCMIALTLAGMVALVLLLILRKGRKTQLPFLPFLLAGYVVLQLT